jgi:ketosteroid isomerase-like protein
MSTEQNKAVVRRFITEVLQGGDLDALDALLAPDYVNPAMGDADRAGFRAILTQLRGGAAMHLEDLELVAEGDAVVARFRLEVTQTGGEKLVAQGLTYYRLADGRITLDDPFTRPDLAQLLGVAPPAA